MSDAPRTIEPVPTPAELPPKASWLLRAACVLALVALGLMSWSLLDPRPAPVVIAMSLGQLFGTTSLAAFLVVVAFDYRRLRRAAQRANQSTST